MPRRPDATLEDRIIAAALWLWDRGGESAITLRAVAKQAGTTTPTIYQRFRDREELLVCLVALVTDELMATFQPLKTIEAIFRAFVEYCDARPCRLSLMIATFGTRLVTGEATPVLELLKQRIGTDLGVNGRMREDLALAIAALAFGTAQGMIAVRSDPKRAKRLQQTSQAALKILLATFSAKTGGTRRLRPKRRG